VAARKVASRRGGTPLIVFGLLGLAVFIGFFGMPRSAPLGRCRS